jgi:hypothetical protein
MTISTLFYEFGFCEIVVQIQQFLILPTIFSFFSLKTNSILKEHTNLIHEVFETQELSRETMFLINFLLRLLHILHSARFDQTFKTSLSHQ